jgi:hypothetical protein
MPARTNSFQRLIRLIYGELAGSGAQVRESVLMRDPVDGTEREIDVVIDTEMAGHPVAIAVECRDHSRRAGVQWIDQIIGKYRNLPIDKVVAVSSAGFHPSAVRKARAHRMETMTLEQASQTDWARLVRDTGTRRFLSLRTILPAGFTINAPGQPEPPDLASTPPDQIMLALPGLEPRPLTDEYDAVAEEPPIKDFLNRCGSGEVPLAVRYPEGTQARLPSGAVLAVEGVVYHFRIQDEEVDVELAPGRFGSRTVGVASAESDSWTADFALVEHPTAPATMGLTIRRRDGGKIGPGTWTLTLYGSDQLPPPRTDAEQT